MGTLNDENNNDENDDIEKTRNFCQEARNEAVSMIIELKNTLTNQYNFNNRLNDFESKIDDIEESKADKSDIIGVNTRLDKIENKLESLHKIRADISGLNIKFDSLKEQMSSNNKVVWSFFTAVLVAILILGLTR